jgi:Flp pilus assembly secretin CpaC
VLNVLCFLVISLNAFAATIPPQNIVRGQTATIETDYEIGNVAIGDQSISDYLIQSNRREVYLNARKAGTTTLTLWDTQGTRRDVIPISVSSQDMGALQQEAAEIFGPGTKLKLSKYGDQVVIDGEATSPAEAEKIESYVQRNPNVRSVAKLSPEAQQTLARKIETAIEIPGIHVRAVQGRLMMEGLAYSAESAARAEKIAKLFDPGIMNLIEVKETKRRPGKEPMVILDVYFMEVKKSAIRTLGISWTPGGTPSGGMSGSGGMFGNLIGSAVGTVFNLLPKIRWVHESGNGRILEQPSLIVKSGDAGEFFSGTQVPYYSAQNVQFKEVGIKLSAEPISSGGAVDLKISATLSTLSAGVNQGIDTHTVNTVAYCKAGESLVLANLYRNGDSKTWNRLPQGVDTSSALFTLVASRDFQSHTTDLVIFVTPRVVEAGDTAGPEMARFQELDEQITRKRSRKEWRAKFSGRETISRSHQGEAPAGGTPAEWIPPSSATNNVMTPAPEIQNVNPLPKQLDAPASPQPYAIELPAALQPTGGNP